MKQQEKLTKLRHSTSHLLASAVLKLFPEAKPAIGPAIENGFYYDFEFANPISDEDFQKIEAKMHEIIKHWTAFEKIVVTNSEAIKMFKDNPYKLELIKDLDKANKEITFYKSGDFIDLCKGGHIENPAKNIKYFKLLKIAGAYFKGDENNKMLTRIYGTAFFTEKELNEYLTSLEEAKKRDHRILGQKLDLFLISDKVGGGLPLWTPKGTILRNLLDEFVWELRKKRGYEKVEIPHITKKKLFEISGHWDKFSDELFKITTREGHEFAMKPMNCPYHTQLFARRQNSYKDLPVRYANTTMVYRDEQSGELSGLSRVRSITQDDAHVFCRETDIETEALNIWDIIDEFYKTAGFEMQVTLSLSDPNEPKKYLGDRSKWDFAENALRKLAKKRGYNPTEAIGEAAFYGPKLDFITKDSLQREWQVATIQLDFNMPERFDLFCINEKGEKERIVMLHAAIMGSIERYLSILIEHFAGAFPTWLSPEQVRIIPISDQNISYAKSILLKLQQNNVRATIDFDSERMQNKVRKAQEEKVPYMLILGAKEESENTVSIRYRTEKQNNNISFQAFLEKLIKNIENKELNPELKFE